MLRTKFLHPGPEPGAVVHLLQMREFVRDDVVDDVRRGLDEPPVEADFAFGVAASPAGFCAR